MERMQKIREAEAQQKQGNYFLVFSLSSILDDFTWDFFGGFLTFFWVSSFIWFNLREGK